MYHGGGSIHGNHYTDDRSSAQHLHGALRGQFAYGCDSGALRRQYAAFAGRRGQPLFCAVQQSIRVQRKGAGLHPVHCESGGKAALVLR